MVPRPCGPSTALGMMESFSNLHPVILANAGIHWRFEVELAADSMWLESRAEISVLAGANLALIGDEIIQFQSAVAISPRRFLLSGLLRGRRGTESAISTHSVGERFVMLSPEALFAIDVPTDLIGTDIKIRAAAPNTQFANAPLRDLRVSGRALHPLAPAHLKVFARGNGDVEVRWARKSRAGFGWIDGVDAPIAEESEAYRLRFESAGIVHEVETGSAHYIFDAVAQSAVFGALPGAFNVAVAQLSAVTGAGEYAVGDFALAR